MDYKDLTILFIKLAGLAIIVFTVAGLPTHISYFYGSEGSILPLIVFLGLNTAPLLLGAFLWFFPTTVANRRFVQDTEAQQEAESITNLFLGVAVIVLGLYLLFRAISDTVYLFTLLYIRSPNDMTNFSENVANTIVTLVEVVLALVLIFGAKGLITLIHKFRGSGRA